MNSSAVDIATESVLRRKDFTVKGEASSKAALSKLLVITNQQKADNPRLFPELMSSLPPKSRSLEAITMHCPAIEQGMKYSFHGSKGHVGGCNSINMDTGCHHWTEVLQ